MYSMYSLTPNETVIFDSLMSNVIHYFPETLVWKVYLDV